MCHDGTAEELKQRVLGLQQDAAAKIGSLGEELEALHVLVGSRRASLTAERFGIVAELVRKAQFRLDWVYSENSTGFHNNSMLMSLLEEAGSLEASARQFKKCLGLVPDHPEYLVKLAEIYVRLGDAAKAEEVLEQCLANHPGHEQAKKILETVAAERHGR